MTMVDWWAQVFSAAGDVWTLRAPEVLKLGPRASIPVAAGVAVLAGIATMIGHTVVFAINRVTGLRMAAGMALGRSEEHTSELQSRGHLVCRLLLEKKKMQFRLHKKKQKKTE